MNDVATTWSLGLFSFLAAGAVSLFSFLSLAVWVEARKTERLSIERLALYRKLAESPTASAELVLAKLREDDAKKEAEARATAHRSRRDSLQGGTIVLAVALGLGFFLRMIAPASGVWTVSTIVALIGLTIIAFSFRTTEK
jgi:hypothetical protein